MQKTGYSFLDLTVMPFARKRVISANATILFDAEFKNILWANAAGTDLFASGHVIELLEAKLSTRHPLINQIKTAADQVHDDNEIVRNFRIAQGLRSITLQGAVKKQKLPDDSPVYLVIFESIDKKFRKQEHVLAEAAVKSLDGFADASAIVDEFGLLIASSEDFDQMNVLPSVIAQLVQETAEESDRMVKRGITSENGDALAAGIGRIHDVPSRYIVVLAEMEEEELSDPREFNPADQTSSIEQHEITSPPWELENPNDVADQVQTFEFSEPKKNLDEPSDVIETESNEVDAEPSLLDRWYFKDGDDTIADTNIAGNSDVDETSIAPSLSGVSADENFETEQDDDKPIRFAFTIGSDLIFNSVSPELQKTVGPISADIVGASWSQVASQYGFDESGSIEKLLKRADTWSGKSVLWPVQDTDMIMPIDLAALPVFNKDRQFDGFRGFGIIRTSDAVIDVDARGMRLEEIKTSKFVSNNNESSTEDNWAESPAQLEDADETSHSVGWQTDLDTEKDEHLDTDSSNIVSIDGRNYTKSDDQVEELSEREATAFKVIKNQLEAENNVEPDNSDTSKLRSQLAQFDSPVLVYTGDKTLFANAELLELSGYASVEELSEFGGVLGLLSDFEFDEKDIDSLKLKRKDGTSVVVYPVLKRVDWEGTSALCLTFTDAEPIADANLVNTKQRASKLPVEERSALDMVQVSDLENILDTAADGVLVLTSDGTIDALNSSGEALFAKSQNDVAGKPFTSLFAKESQGTLQAYLDNLNDPTNSSILNDGREVIGIEANGGLIPMFASIGSIGNSGRFCVVLRDLTERKKSEEELVTAKRAAETASEQKSEFLARMSHEIREPLNAIIGFSDIMIEERFGPVQNERYKEYLKDVNRSGIHVLDLVNDLLDISKIEAGKIELSYEAVDLNQLASETVALLQPQANNQRIIIRTSLSRAVPKVVADARSIRQIILNLASNAIRHSPPNSQVIVSTTFEENGEVGLRVRDTGNGMSEDELAVAMEPFSQVKTADINKSGSTGLGLPLTKALIEANRAYFELESTPGEGTIAFVQFPSQRVLAD